MTAFEKYLLEDKTRAVEHLLSCLMSEGPAEMAWELIARFKGEKWSCRPGEIRPFLGEVWESLKAESQKEGLK